MALPLVLLLALALAPGLLAAPPDPSLDLATRMLGGRAEGRGLARSALAGLLHEGLAAAELARVHAAAATPRVLPLADELRVQVDALVASPPADTAVLAWVAELGADLAGLAARLHAENLSYQPYSIRLPGFGVAPRPGAPVEVRIRPGEPGQPPRPEADALLARVLPAYAEHPRLRVRRYGPVDELEERLTGPGLDLGLGLDLIARGPRALRRAWARQLRRWGVWVLPGDQVRPATPRRVAPGYVERHVVELARRSERLREVLAGPLAAAHAPGAGPGEAARFEAELQEAGRRLRAYLQAWRENLGLLEALAERSDLVAAGRRLGLQPRAARERVDLLRTRVRADRLGSYAGALQGPLGEALSRTARDLEGFLARARQALPGLR